MKNEAQWSPTKFDLIDGALQASLNPRHLAIDSRIVAGFIAEGYTRALTRYARGSLLDLGCGQAPFYGMYRPLVNEVTCVDWDSSPHDQQFVDVAADLNQSLPLPDRQFDTAILSDVLEHIHHPRILLEEILRVLNPGGHLLLNVPFLYPIHEAPFDFHRYTDFRLRQLAEQSGLLVEELTPLGAPRHVVGTLFGKSIRRGPIGNIARRLTNQIVYALDQVKPSASAPVMPLMYFVVLKRPSVAP